MHTIKGKILEERFIKECGTKVTVTLTFNDLENLPSNYHDHPSREPNTSQRKPVSNTISRKKKAPSRIKRDRKRFREWLDRRKDQQKSRKTSSENKTVSKEPSFAQCSPPEDTTITVCRPESVTIVKPVSPVVAPPEPAPVTPAESDIHDSHPCICDLCRTFIDVDPLKKYYQTCGNCGKPATELQPLKPCSRCLCCAYCGKECQTLSWKSKHKQECSKEIAEQVRAVRTSWTTAKEIWLKHKIEPFQPLT